MNCTQCGNTGLVPVEKGPAGATYTVLARCKCQTDTITIPRAQYEALRAAAKFVRQYMAAAAKTGERGSLYGDGQRICAALEAALSGKDLIRELEAELLRRPK